MQTIRAKPGAAHPRQSPSVVILGAGGNVEPNALKPGSELEGYRIEGIERDDGTCVLLLAHDPVRERAVALHVARHETGSMSAVRFLERARRLSAINHPHLLAIFDSRLLDDRPGAVGAAPRGARLDHVLGRGPLEAAGATRLTRQIASAVDALETAGAEVPALSPERIWIDAGGAQLDALDAGVTLTLARPASSSADLAGLLSLMVGVPPPELAGIVHRALDGAYLSAGQLAAALAEVEHRTRREHRRRAALLVAVLATVALIVVLIATLAL
jgi:hypothetical protein